MVGTQLGLEQLERRLEERDRLRHPAGIVVGDGQEVAALEGVGVVETQPCLAKLERLLVERDGLG